MQEQRFKIGDLVITKAGLEECHLASLAGRLRIPIVYMIVEINIQECPGGRQVFYIVGSDGERYDKFNDIELTDPSSIPILMETILESNRETSTEQK